MRIEMPKGVKEMELTPQKVVQLYKKFDSIPGLFDDYSRGDFKLFESRLKAPDALWFETEDGNGVLYATSIMVGLSGIGHFVFFDRRLKGREGLVMSVLRYVMAGADLKKMNVYLPAYAGSARHFLDRLGFKHEGCLRRWSYSKNRLYDMHLYGITFEEAFDGSAESFTRREPGEGMGPGSDELVQSAVRTPSGGPGQSLDSPGNGLNAPDDQPSGPGNGGLLRGDDEDGGSGPVGDTGQLPETP